MAFTRNNTAEGGTDGVGLTAGNSGGASGDAFQGFLGPPTFSNLHPASGSMGIRLQITGNDGCAWETLSGTTLYGRTYVYLVSFGATSQFRISEFLNSGYGDSGGWINLGDGATRTVQLFDGAATVAATSSMTLSLSTMYRIEFKVFTHASTGTLEARIYLNHSTTPLETISATGLNTLNSGAFAINRRRASIGTFDIFIDDININDTDWPGPSVIEAAGLPKYDPMPMVKDAKGRVF